VLVDVSIAAASAIKQQLAPKLARPPAITADSKAMYLVIAPWKPRPKLATSAVKKATFPGTVPKQELLAKEEVVAEEHLRGPNAIVVAKLGILRGRALTLLLEAEAEVEDTEDTVKVVEEEDMVEVVVAVVDSATPKPATLAVV
jgi:hypothetical protein